MKIYTGYGDKGFTSLSGGEKVKKNDPRVEVYGTIDELSSSLGIAVAKSETEEIRERIKQIQNELFVISAEIASPPGKMPASITPINETCIRQLEEKIDALQAALPELRHFILPGGTEGAAFLHSARTVTRRAERLLVKLMESVPVREELLIYLNRLSDLLFVMARYENNSAGKEEHFWRQT
jgi:cob(I)alamin adenosyltransferase